MCGINGIFMYAGGAVGLDELRTTRDYMAPRGPDGLGEYVNSDMSLGLGHRRLSIIDLSEGGNQPMATDDGNIVVTFNGEIYNYREIRDRLSADGIRLRSRSDTEVLLHLYRLHGFEMFQYLRGMYAFGLWDARQRRLVLARDPYGIKPLYYSNDGNGIRFASSVKALVAGGKVSTAASAPGLVGFALLGSVPEPWTSYESVRNLPAGSFMVAGPDGVEPPRPHFSLAGTYCVAEANSDRLVEPETMFRASALASVRAHLVADVPVGIFLSAGVDSGALLGLIRECGQSDIQAITLAYADYLGSSRDEAPLARMVAERYGAAHVVRTVERSEFLADLPRILAAMDQPSIDGINTWFVAKAAREQGLKVAISGLGGDELMGGYSTFKRIPRIVLLRRILQTIPGAMSLLTASVRTALAAGIRLHPKAAGFFNNSETDFQAWLLIRGIFLPTDVPETLLHDPDFVAEGLEQLDLYAGLGTLLDPMPKTRFSRVAVLESGMYMRNQLLRDSDWAGMAHGLEIRTPLVDRQLLEEVAPLFARDSPPWGKKLLAAAPTVPLPDLILNRPKTGFGIPVREWMGHNAPADPRQWSRFWMQRVLDHQA